MSSTLPSLTPKSNVHTDHTLDIPAPLPQICTHIHSGSSFHTCYTEQLNKHWMWWKVPALTATQKVVRWRERKPCWGKEPPWRPINGARRRGWSWERISNNTSRKLKTGGTLIGAKQLKDPVRQTELSSWGILTKDGYQKRERQTGISYKETIFISRFYIKNQSHMEGNLWCCTLSLTLPSTNRICLCQNYFCLRMEFQKGA
jgi:hypothetical protein